MPSKTSGSAQSYDASLSQTDLLKFLSTADETVVVTLIERAVNARNANGMDDDLTHALEKAGIKVRQVSEEKAFWKSKKFIAGVLALGILAADQFLGGDIWTVAVAPLTYIFGQGLADLGKNRTSA